MISNYFTLIAIAKELKQLVGNKMLDCFTQENNSIAFALYDGNAIHHLFFSAHPQSTALYLDRKFVKARRNIATLFQSLVGDYLQDVELLADDRIILLKFIHHNLFFHLFGAGKANAVLCKSDNSIIDALNDIADANNPTKYELKANNLPQFNDFLGPESALAALSKCDLLIGKLYATHLLIEKGIDLKSKILDLFEDDKLDLIKSAEFLINKLVSSKIYYIYIIDEQPTLSLIPIHLAGEPLFTFESISDAVKKARTMKIVHSLDTSLRRDAMHSLSSEKNRLERKIDECRNCNEAIQRANKYNFIAGLLLSQPNAKYKCGSDIRISDYDGQELTIQLDNKLNLIENAQKYFLKAKKSNQDALIKQQRLPSLIDKLNKILALIEELEETSNIKKLRQFIEQLKSKKIAKRMENWKKTPEEKFKTYTLDDGFTLFVGKNAANNDELTMKFAKSNDLWLHARGTSGSHAVLKMKNDAKPPKAVLQVAAEITAYHSSARNGKYVPVSYTHKKFVRKPKGAAIGAVVIAREDVIMVEPKLPTNNTI